MQIKALLGALALVALSGCVSTPAYDQPQMMWTRPNSSNADLVQDRQGCIYEAQKAAPYARPDSLPVLNLAIECLKSKGWQLVPATQ